jgi:hypothetical protein
MVRIRRDPARLQKLRTAVRYLLREDALERGHQTRLAEHFSVSRQRVHQVVNEEQQRRENARAVKQKTAELLARRRLEAVTPAHAEPASDSYAAP